MIIELIGRDCNISVENKGFETDCWIWKGVIHTNGYGLLCVGTRPRKAHRVVYEKFFAQERRTDKTYCTNVILDRVLIRIICSLEMIRIISEIKRAKDEIHKLRKLTAHKDTNTLRKIHTSLSRDTENALRAERNIRSSTNPMGGSDENRVNLPIAKEGTNLRPKTPTSRREVASATVEHAGLFANPITTVWPLAY